MARALQLRVEARRLLAALAQHYRLRFLPQVVSAFRDLVDGVEGKVRGQVTLPAPPDPEQVATLARALQAMLGVRVELEAAVDPDMLAGFVVRLGSRVYDGSLRTQLEKFAERMSKRGE
jgi:F-type H+-transporting ATPase subunit delta